MLSHYNFMYSFWILFDDVKPRQLVQICTNYLALMSKKNPEGIVTLAYDDSVSISKLHSCGNPIL
jgi:hypothetical protein